MAENNSPNKEETKEEKEIQRAHGLVENGFVEKAALTGASRYAERVVKLGLVNQSFSSIAKACSERADVPQLRDEFSLLERSLEELRI